MKARIIHTAFYNSERVLALSMKARWLFMYYLTCPHIGLTGAFKTATVKTIFETGLKAEELRKAQEELENAHLTYFINEWVVIPETNEKTGYDKGNRTGKAYENELSQLPDEIKTLVLSKVDTLSGKGDRVSRKADTPRNHKTENRNKKQGESVRGESLAEATLDEPLKVLEYWNPLFGTSFTSPRSIRSNMTYWREVYSMDQIFEAVRIASTDSFWKDKITPEILFRRKNQQGEDVDYIGKLLNSVKKDRPVQVSNLSPLERARLEARGN